MGMMQRVEGNGVDCRQMVVRPQVSNVYCYASEAMSRGQQSEQRARLKNLEPVGRSRPCDPGHPRHVPETWPALLSREQLCAYIGVSASTLVRICPVRPLDLGASITRYSRAHIDEWVATLPPRLMVQRHAGDVRPRTSGLELDTISETRTDAALDRVRARAGSSKWRKTAS